jgi:hypothetical protein
MTVSGDTPATGTRGVQFRLPIWLVFWSPPSSLTNTVCRQAYIQGPDFPNRLIVSTMPRMQMMASDDGVSVFESVRPRLFGIAYRMLGSAAEAEDIVQDAWLRWQGTDRSAVVDPPAFLATATMRLAITVRTISNTINRICSPPFWEGLGERRS